jgi:lipopolysaccharide/colanic/teichoic acid biosynthesis glycosyltransferase
MLMRLTTSRSEALRRLRRSPLVAHSIPAPLRALDVALVLVAMPFALLVGAVLALAVFLDSPGPIFYRSRRIGRGGEPFAMLKFRTMVRDAAGPPISAHGDERYTPLGRWLARSRLDELPQLWNVLRGEMRLVGPRPEVEDFVRNYPSQYERILSVPPGLTGPAQVEFAWEGEVLAAAEAVDRARVYRESILPLKLEIDLSYAEHHSVRGDLGLLARTLALPVVRSWRLLRRLLGDAEGSGITPRLGAAAALVATIIVLAGLLAAESATPF